DIATSLRLLTEMLRASKLEAAWIADRRERWTREHERMVRDLRAVEAKAQGELPVDPVALLAALGTALPPETIYVDETITHAGLLRQHLPLSRPQSYFRTGGGLGQGLGIALGVKLAAPERPVVLIVGDGSFLYNPIVQAFG